MKRAKTETAGGGGDDRLSLITLKQFMKTECVSFFFGGSGRSRNPLGNTQNKGYEKGQCMREP